MNPNFRNIVSNSYLAPSLAVVALGTMTGCGNANEQAASTSPETVVQPTFDSHGNPPYVRVYPGPSETASDRKSIGQYNDGDPLAISCIAEGRSVDSYVEGGASSNKWLKLKEQLDGQDQYASLIYTRLPKGLLSQLAACK